MVILFVDPILYAQSGPCTGCSPIDPGGTCLNLINSWCEGSVGNVNIDYGDSGDPIPLVTAICNACASSQDQTAQYEFSQTTGRSFCLTGTGGASWNALGFGWSVSLSGQLCFDSTNTKSVTANLNCAAGTVVQVEVWKIERQVNISADIDYTQWATYENTCNGGSTHNTSFPCNSETVTATTTENMYVFAWEDLDCETAPGSCGDKALTVYHTIYYEDDSSHAIIEHIVEDVIPCYYYEF